MSFTVAIDGPAAAGKGTISKQVAAHFGFAHLDTGLLYRATGRKTLDGTDAVEAALTLKAEDLEAEDLRGPEVAQAASRVAAVPEVRAALLDFQRAFAMRAGGAVLDGRDIGTVICPNAQVKMYVTASDDIRATRRHKELTEKGHQITYEEVLEDLRQRDARDSARTTAPLKPADDAVVLDTSQMSIERRWPRPYGRLNRGRPDLPWLAVSAEITDQRCAIAQQPADHVQIVDDQRGGERGKEHPCDDQREAGQSTRAQARPEVDQQWRPEHHMAQPQKPDIAHLRIKPGHCGGGDQRGGQANKPDTAALGKGQQHKGCQKHHPHQPCKPDLQIKWLGGGGFGEGHAVAPFQIIKRAAAREGKARLCPCARLGL